MEKGDRALTIREVALFLNISNQMVYNLIKARELSAFKIGSALRILQSDLLGYVNRQKKRFDGAAGAFANADDSLFVIRDLTIREGAFTLANFNLSFRRGKILGLLGPSGSGKTLLLRSIAGLIRPAAGSVFLGERRLDLLSVQERGISFAFQDDRRAAELLGKEKAKKEDFFRSDLILLDEPFARLDTALHQKFITRLRELARDGEKTVIVATVNPRDVLALSDYTAILETGRLIQFGETREVYDYPVSALALELFSCLGVNRLPIQVQEQRIMPWGIAVDRPNGAYDLLFRTEEIRLDGRGIAVLARNEHFYDGRKKMVEAVLADRDGNTAGAVLTLLVPVDSGAEFSFMPEKIRLFDHG